MTMYEQDLDVVLWGLHLLDVCRIPCCGGSPGSTTHYEKDLSKVECVEEGYCETKCNEVENDEIIAHALQEELSRLAAAEASGSLEAGEEDLQASILSQDWQAPSNGYGAVEHGGDHRGTDESGKPGSCSSPREESFSPESQPYSPEIEIESVLDGEVGKRLNQMVPIPHVPKINGDIPSADEEISDHQRLLERLRLYELVELKVQGDGNCQFRALSDQIYRTTEYHKFVREQVVGQLQSLPELYEAYVPMAYDHYLKNISKTGEWGDHVALQAAADAGLLAFYGLLLPHTLVELSTELPTSLPQGLKFELQTLPVDAKAVADGDTITVYVSTIDPRESSVVPRDVHIAAVERSEARADRNYPKADALHQKIIDSGYRVLNIDNEEILSRKYRIRLRGIDAPESKMPYGQEAKEELTKIVQGKSLRVLVFDQDRYGRSVGDIYCNGKFVQEVMLKKGLAWHYKAYDQRPELEKWEREARAKRVGLWASANPEMPWEWRKDRREGR